MELQPESADARPGRGRPRPQAIIGTERVLSRLINHCRSLAGSLPDWARQLLAIARIDFDPPGVRLRPILLVFASLVALGGSLVADAVIVRVGSTILPSTLGYTHFVFADYAKLTIIGVVVACAAWPITQLITSAPRWLFLRFAVVVTAVLLLPDAYIFLLGQPGQAIAVLVAMHIGIALVTYNALVRIVPGGGVAG